MSGAEDHSSDGPGVASSSGADDFQLPVSEAGRDESGRKLRRRLFGYRRADVEAELTDRAEEMGELRRDISALWLAFGQHERTIRQMLVAVERLTGVQIDAPGGRADRGLQVIVDEGLRATAPPDAAQAPSPPAEENSLESESEAAAAGPLAASIGEQLSDLDEVLAAIEGATKSLERTYHEQTAEGEAAGEPPPTEGEVPEDDNKEEEGEAGER